MNHRRRQGRAIRAVTMNHQLPEAGASALVLDLINTSLPKSRDLLHVLALELPRLSM